MSWPGTHHGRGSSGLKGIHDGGPEEGRHLPLCEHLPQQKRRHGRHVDVVATSKGPEAGDRGLDPRRPVLAVRVAAEQLPMQQIRKGLEDVQQVLVPKPVGLRYGNQLLSLVLLHLRDVSICLSLALLEHGKAAGNGAVCHGGVLHPLLGLGSRVQCLGKLRIDGNQIVVLVSGAGNHFVRAVDQSLPCEALGKLIVHALHAAA
mmetsp:Transcript_35351/g.100074  ORF Transcript_35351/g.100074 Transcript_35351/m.100074 type:complete len:204 (-) Transcript_35351:652-1263(-)